MSKFTRRLKKNKKNITIKRGGAEPEIEKSKREGIIDVVGNEAYSIASKAATAAGDVGLRIMGLERINKTSEEDEYSKNVNENINKVKNTTSKIMTTVGNVLDKTGGVVINNINEILGSEDAKVTTKEAAEKTAQIIKNGAETFNEALNDPEVKAELEKSIKKAGEFASVVVEASEKPLDKAVDVAANATSKATGAALSGFIKVGTDMMAAVPGLGAVIEVGKMLNDGSKATSAVIEAGSEAVEVASDAFIETKENVEKGLKLLEEKKKFGNNVYNRTTKSINDFENPIAATQTAGGHKTKRRFLKRKAKTTRVRFAI